MAEPLRLVSETDAAEFPWPGTGEGLSISDAHHRIRDLLDQLDGYKTTCDDQSRRLGRLERRMAEEIDPMTHPKGKEIVDLIRRWMDATGHPKSKLSDDRVKLVKARLKDGFSIEELALAIDGLAAFPFVRNGQRVSEGKTSERHDRMGIVFGGGESVEKFANLGAIARRKYNETTQDKRPGSADDAPGPDTRS